MTIENPKNADTGRPELPEAKGENPFTLEDLELIPNNNPREPEVVGTVGDRGSDDGDKLG